MSEPLTEEELERWARHVAEQGGMAGPVLTPRLFDTIRTLRAALATAQANASCEDSRNENACGGCLACAEVGRDHALRQRDEALKALATARRDALEEAAQIADIYSVNRPHSDSLDSEGYWVNDCYRSVADAIRSLATTPPAKPDAAKEET